MEAALKGQQTQEPPALPKPAPPDFLDEHNSNQPMNLQKTSHTSQASQSGHNSHVELQSRQSEQSGGASGKETWFSLKFNCVILVCLCGIQACLAVLCTRAMQSHEKTWQDGADEEKLNLVPFVS